MLLDSLNGRFLDQGELGRGGTGVVRRVYDQHIERTVALKVVHRDLSAADRQRFADEARTTALLEHPNILPVYDVFFDSSGDPYSFAMKLVEGGQFADVLSVPLEGGEEGLLERLAVLSKVCDALALAHSRGVIHRDVNPKNVMVGRFGEAYLTDWGLALRLEDVRDTDDADCIGLSGTPCYMAPEQAEGRVHAIDPRTDVFALGATLYEILVGRPPFEGSRFAEVLELARRCEVRFPEVSQPSSSELRRIALKALARDPDDRYGDVLEMKRDIEDFIRGGGWFPRVRFPAGATILSEGAEGDVAYILIEGRCEVFRIEAGERRRIREVGPGEVFGEIALFTDTRRTADVRALTDVSLLTVRRAALANALDRSPWMGAFVRAAAERFVELDSKERGR